MRWLFSPVVCVQNVVADVAEDVVMCQIHNNVFHMNNIPIVTCGTKNSSGIVGLKKRTALASMFPLLPRESISKTDTSSTNKRVYL